MQTDPRDKKILPEDFIEPATGELSENQDEPDKEQDLDELVHNLSNETALPNEEIDADDAIHKSIRKIPSTPGNENDPDDMVHGHL